MSEGITIIAEDVAQQMLFTLRDKVRELQAENRRLLEDLCRIRAAAARADKALGELDGEKTRLREALREIPMVNHIYGDRDARADRIEEIVRAALTPAGS
jgi:predicted nuclease with TOPRIM domain